MNPHKLITRSSPSPTKIVYTPKTKTPYGQQRSFHLKDHKPRRKGFPTTAATRARLRLLSTTFRSRLLSITEAKKLNRSYEIRTFERNQKHSSTTLETFSLIRRTQNQTITQLSQNQKAHHKVEMGNMEKHYTGWVTGVEKFSGD